MEKTLEKPFILFQDWFRDAQEKEPSFPEAMTLSSVNKNGHPSSRVVLLKKTHFKDGLAEQKKGFVFFTNMNSHKSQDLIQHPQTALCFYWKTLCRQVRIQGVAHPVSNQEADEYFASRPRESQIGAWASYQSAPLESTESLEKKVKEITDKFSNKKIPRPSFWSGFLIEPHYFEFWSEKPFRLHERISFSLTNNQWAEQLLFP